MTGLLSHFKHNVHHNEFLLQRNKIPIPVKFVIAGKSNYFFKINVQLQLITRQNLIQSQLITRQFSYRPSSLRYFYIFHPQAQIAVYFHIYALPQVYTPGLAYVMNLWVLQFSNHPLILSLVSTVLKKKECLFEAVRHVKILWDYLKLKFPSKQIQSLRWFFSLTMLSSYSHFAIVFSLVTLTLLGATDISQWSYKLRIS